jgi:RNA polymerase sigma-70 factor (ECF subfamily)
MADVAWGGDFEAFFVANYEPVARAIALATGDIGVAEDATQEAFARAYRRWGRVAAMERPAGWVHVVAMNVARRQLRRRPRLEDREATTDLADEVALGESLRASLAMLPRRQREAVVFRYYADLPLDDVARAMGCAVGTVKSTLHSALAALRIDIDEEAEHAR